MTFFWIIGGGLLQIPLIHEVRQLGYPVIITDANPDCVCKPLADMFFALDIYDIQGHKTLATQLLANGDRILAVLAAGIDAPETMAELCQHLALPSVSPEIARLVNNKDLFRVKMAELGIPRPEFRVIEKKDLPQLHQIANDMGYPLIVKNSCSSGSRGTKIFREETPELETIAAEAIAVSRSGKALLESLWEGSEHTVETLFDCNGMFHRGFITDRLFDKSNGYPLETGLVHPSQLDEKTQEEMYLLAEDVAKKLGIAIGAAKYDMILTKQGPRIIEMTVRLSGGFDCQYLVPAATGKNILKAAALTALNQPFDTTLLEDTKHRVALSESLWPTPGIITAIRGKEAIVDMPGFEHLFFRHAIGDRILPYVDCTKRVCFILVSGSTLAEAQSNMSRIKNTLQIITE